MAVKPPVAEVPEGFHGVNRLGQPVAAVNQEAVAGFEVEVFHGAGLAL